MSTTPAIDLANGSVRVNLADSSHTYPWQVAAFGDHLAAGGRVGALKAFIDTSVEAMRLVGWVKCVEGWVTLDGAPLAYHIRLWPSGSYVILGAAPLPGAPLQAEYDA